MHSTPDSTLGIPKDFLSELPGFINSTVMLRLILGQCRKLNNVDRAHLVLLVSTRKNDLKARHERY